ncbi:MAG: hypothetical protein JXQ87_19680 [Bacteroidia bacterium]
MISNIQAQDLYVSFEIIPRTFEFQSLNIENFDTRIEQNRELSFSIPFEYNSKKGWSYGLTYSYVRFKYDLTMTTPIDKNDFTLFSFNEKSSNIRAQIGRLFYVKKLRTTFTPFLGLNCAYNHSRFIPTGTLPTDSYKGGMSFLAEPNDSMLIYRYFSSPSRFFYHLSSGVNVKYPLTDRILISGTLIANQGLFQISFLDYQIIADSQSKLIFGQLYSRGSNISAQIGITYKITEHNSSHKI